MIAALVFPHQLFSTHPVLAGGVDVCLLIEDPLFFGTDATYPLTLHRRKILYHLDTLDYFERRLSRRSLEVRRVRHGDKPTLKSLIKGLAEEGCETVRVCDVHDDVLGRRLVKACDQHDVTLEWLDTPAFLTTPHDNQRWQRDAGHWRMASYYRWQRERLGVLLDADGGPRGGQWSFDEDNRLKLPRDRLGTLPGLPSLRGASTRSRNIDAVCAAYPDHPGALDPALYPTSHAAASRWLECFLEERFTDFGAYEDAIVEGESWLFHAVLTPMLNTGLLTPREVLDRAIEAADAFVVPLNSVEGFVRQVIGWREFMRASYDALGVEMRNGNAWGHDHPMPAAFYTADTGIAPLDDVISRVLTTGYCHHIERLMVLGGFMFLCEIRPHAIYRWFMELFIDAYDWVMVPNVYAMSQHADGGLITTKPYFSGSNYLRKMGNYPAGDWTDTWDALFWRWIIIHKDQLADNPRWAMMCRNADRMAASRQRELLAQADTFLAALHG